MSNDQGPHNTYQSFPISAPSAPSPVCQCKNCFSPFSSCLSYIANRFSTLYTQCRPASQPTQTESHQQSRLHACRCCFPRRNENMQHVSKQPTADTPLLTTEAHPSEHHTPTCSQKITGYCCPCCYTR